MKLLCLVLVLLVEMREVASSDAVGKLRRRKSNEKPLDEKLVKLHPSPRTWFYDDYITDYFDDDYYDDVIHVDDIYDDDIYDDYFDQLDDMDYFYDTILYDDGDWNDNTWNV